MGIRMIFPGESPDLNPDVPDVSRRQEYRSYFSIIPDINDNILKQDICQ